MSKHDYNWFLDHTLQFLCRGDVVTMECVEKIIKKDWINPLDSTKITEEDIIPLQRVIIILYL